MRKVALKIAGDPGDVSEITALAVTFRQPRKNAENLRVALGAERCVEHAELIARKLPIARASGGTVASELTGFKRFGNIEPGVVYIAGVRRRLDTGKLPKPLQLDAIGSRDWNLSSDWYRWTFKP